MIETDRELAVFISDRIFKLRKQENISGREMSLSLGMGEAYISHIESGNAMPSIQNLFYICDYLGITLKEFFDDETEEPVLINRIVKEIKKLDAKALEKLLEFIETVN